MIVNRQRRVHVAVQPLARFLNHLRETFRLPEEAVTVCLVSDAEIARLNRAFRAKRGTTDVLSFPMDGAEPTKGTPAKQSKHRKQRKQAPRVAFSFASSDSFASLIPYLGDIAISPQAARRNARRFGRTLLEELRILILHGVLHLVGYDHETDGGEMDRLEGRLRGQLRLR